jgi:protein TonB
MHGITKLFTATVVMSALALMVPLAAQDHKIGEPGLTAPRVIYKVEPQYTEDARAAKVAGSVLLKIVVDEQGNADNIEVTRSLDEGLDQKAIEAVHQWRFAPATLDGKPVRVQAAIEVNFRLK